METVHQCHASRGDPPTDPKVSTHAVEDDSDHDPVASDMILNWNVGTGSIVVGRLVLRNGA